MQCDCKNGNSEVSFFHHRVNYSPVCFLRGLLQYNRFNLKSSLRGEAAVFYTHLRCAVRSPKTPAGRSMPSAPTGASPCADCIGYPMTALYAQKTEVNPSTTTALLSIAILRIRSCRNPLNRRVFFAYLLQNGRKHDIT